MSRTLITVLLLTTSLTLPGCPCVHVIRDTVVHIRAVVDSATGSAIDSVFITRVAVDGDSLPLPYAMLGGGHEAGVLLEGDTLRCRLPCSFGSHEGRWQVTLLARGYPLQAVECDAHYLKHHGGCPSYNDIGTFVVLHLSRPAASAIPEAVR